MWWIIGALVMLWGVYAVASSVYYVNRDPSLGLPAMIYIVFGIVAILIGSLLTWLLL